MAPTSPKTRFELRAGSALPKRLVRLTCLMVFLALGSAKGQVPVKNEYQVKVAYLYKIALYVHFKDHQGLTPSKQLVIGILGNDPFGPFLDKIARERQIHSRQIVVKRFSDWAEYEACNLLFISKTASPSLIKQAIQQTRGKGVLLVGESDGFENIGGMFNMYLDSGGKVGIKLNIDATKRSQFRVDARLLQVCDVLRDPKPSLGEQNR